MQRIFRSTCCVPFFLPSSPSGMYQSSCPRPLGATEHGFTRTTATSPPATNPPVLVPWWQVLYAESSELVHGLAEPWTAFLLWVQQQKGFSRIVAPSSAFSRGLLPRAAALLDAPMVSDVVRILGPHTFVR